jgi:hypothetical protein
MGSHSRIGNFCGEDVARRSIVSPTSSVGWSVRTRAVFYLSETSKAVWAETRIKTKTQRRIGVETDPGGKLEPERKERDNHNQQQKPPRLGYQSQKLAISSSEPPWIINLHHPQLKSKLKLKLSQPTIPNNNNNNNNNNNRLTVSWSASLIKHTYTLSILIYHAYSPHSDLTKPSPPGRCLNQKTQPTHPTCRL